MTRMNQFKAVLAAVMLEDTANILHNMKYHNAQTFDYVGFFAHHAIRNTIIPEFDHVNMLMQCSPYASRPTVYDNKFMHYLKDSTVAPTDTALDRDFWSNYVRDHIHAFVRTTWSQNDCMNGMYITRAEADQILRISRRVRNYGPASLLDWEDTIKHDYMHRYEIVYSGLFDVKMNYNKELNDRSKRPVYLYSYGPKAWANCMTFVLRMQWNNLVAQTI